MFEGLKKIKFIVNDLISLIRDFLCFGPAPEVCRCEYKDSSDYLERIHIIPEYQHTPYYSRDWIDIAEKSYVLTFDIVHG